MQTVGLEGLFETPCIIVVAVTNVGVKPCAAPCCSPTRSRCLIMWMRFLVLASLGLIGVTAFDGVALSGPVKVTIQAAKNESGEGATLPIDPTLRVRYGIQDTQMPGLGGMNGERLTF